MRPFDVVLVWGMPADPPVSAVCDALRKSGTPIFVLSQQLATVTELDMRVDSQIRGMISIAGMGTALEDVSAAYVRPHDSRRLPEVAAAGEGSSEWRHAIGVEDLLLTWCELTTARVINRPSAMASNGSKPYQGAFARAHGFNTPETLITCDREAALQFWSKHGNVIYKSISGVRSIVTRLTPAHLPRFGDLIHCPTQFQEHVPGKDFRVHVVGSDYFACEVVSDADDYRYVGRQGGDLEIQSCDLPGEVADQCRELAADLNLPVAGVDLRRTPDGQWYCFEVNPSPGFTFYESWTGQPIAQAIAHLLSGR